MAASIVSQSVSTTVVPTSPPRPHASVYEIITAQILAELERGQVPWRKPWRAELPLNLISGKPYRGINVFLLASQGYESRDWVTLNQANKLGGELSQESTPRW